MGIEEKNKFSFIMPNLNGDLYLEDAIKSFIAQSYGNKELIIVDGRSTDNSHKIISEWTRRFNSIIWVDTVDTGLSNAFNIGVQRSSGDYIAFFASDDTLCTDVLVKTNDVLFNNSYDLVFYDAYNKFPNGVLAYWKCHTPSINLDNLILNGPNFGGEDFFIKKEIISSLKWDEECLYAPDYEFILRLVASKDVVQKYLNLPFTINKHHQCNISTLYSKEQDDEVLRIIEKYNINGMPTFVEKKRNGEKIFFPKKKNWKGYVPKFLKKIYHQNIKEKTSLALHPQYLKTSYSQLGEDLIVSFIFKSRGCIKPSYIDIGAHHPEYLNNTNIFYQEGSRGVNVEPDPILFCEFEEKRKDDVNLNIGIAESNSILDFYIMAIRTLNTFSKEEAERIEKENNIQVKEIKQIPTYSITDVIKKYCDGIFPDFLSIDVEGLDFEIIKKIDYSDTFPKVICIESVSYSENGNGMKNHEMMNFLESKGYMLFADTYINSIFVLKAFWIL